MKLGEFLTTLARKSNMENDPQLLSLLSNSEIANKDVADEFAHSLDTNLMSLEGAKNNPAVLNHYRPIMLKAIDEKVAAIAEKYGIQDEVTAEKSSYRKLDIIEAGIAKKISEIESKQNTTVDKDKEAQYAAQLQDLQKQLQSVSEAKAAELSTVKSQYENEITEMHFQNLLSGVKFATKDLPMEVNTQVAKTLINAKLKESGATLVRVGNEMKLVQSANPEMAYVDAGFKPVSFGDFTNKVLADNKLLEVSNSSQQQSQAAPAPVYIQGGGANQNTSKFDAALADAMK